MEEKKCVTGAEDAQVRIDVFLTKKEPDVSRTRIKGLILAGKVFVNGAVVKPHHKLREGDIVAWQAPEHQPCDLAPENIPLDILFEDADILVLDKPAGLVVHPGAGNEFHTLVHALLFHTQDLSSLSPQRPGIVHRLDKETSGVMVIAKNNASHLTLARQFKKHTIERRYVALVEGIVDFDEGVIDVPVKRHAVDRKRMSVGFTEDAKSAHTFYRVLKRYRDTTALELMPRTGRTHQLRVHLSYLGHPVLGDMTYGRKKNFPRLALHAKDLGFIHPSSGTFMKFSSPLPALMKSAMPGLKI